MNESEHFIESLYEFLGVGSDSKAVLSLPHVNSALGTARGLVREDNQDRALVLRSSFATNSQGGFLLFAISDGIGGMAEGAACARLAISSFANAIVFLDEPELGVRVEKAFKHSNADVFNKFNGKGGATLSILLISKADQSVTLGHVGDSRVYAFQKGKEPKVEQITIDDTIEAHMAQIAPNNQGDLAPELKGRLAQYMGMSEGLVPTVVRRDINSQSREGYVLTTDGVHSVSAETLFKIIENGQDSQEITGRLIDVSLWCGGSDNASVVVVSPDTVTQFLASKKTHKRMATAWSPFRQLDVSIVRSGEALRYPGKSEAKQNTNDSEDRDLGGAENPQKNKRSAKRKKNNKKKQSADEADTADIDDDEDQISIEFIEN